MPSEFRTYRLLAAAYLRTALRSVTRHRGYVALNVGGLVLGLSAATVIGLFVFNSLRFDDFHRDADRIYRVLQDRGALGLSTRPAPGIARLIRDSFPGVASVTQFNGFESIELALTVGDAHHQMDGVITADDSFLETLTFDMVRTGRDRPLEEPGTMIVTESTARRLFAEEDPIGRRVVVDAGNEYTVVAVAADPPPNTHLPFNVLIRGFTRPQDVQWRYWGYRVYVKLEPGTAPRSISDRLTQAFEAANPGAVGGFRLQPVRDIHLYSDATEEYAPVGDVRYLLVFGSIAVIILLLASINTMNLATVRAARRTREVGIRKALGATSDQVRRQLLTESLMLVVVSVPLALLVANLALPEVNRLTGETLSIGMLTEPVLLAASLAVVGVMVLAAGLYPATVLARRAPSEALAGGRGGVAGRRTVRSVLVGVQVAVSFGMIAATALILGQMRYIQESNLGFDQEQVVLLSPRDWSMAQFEHFRDRVTASPGIETAAAGLPLGLNWRTMGWRSTPVGSTQEVETTVMSVGVGFFRTAGIGLVEGRTFREEDLQQGSPPVVVSRAWAELNANGGPVVGRVIEQLDEATVVGVVEDIRNASFRESPQVLVYALDNQEPRAVLARLAAGRTAEGLAALQTGWEELSPDRPFTYRFLDEWIGEQYVAEDRLARIFGIFAGLSILIACLGLFGLAAMSAEQRVREIGIRKALGATIANIVGLLSREFVVIVGVAVVVVLPPLVIFGSKWLDGFDEHVALGPGVFLLAAGLTFAFVLLSVGVRATFAAMANPTDALRQE